MRKKILFGIIGTMLLVSACTSNTNNKETETNATTIEDMETSDETQEEASMVEQESLSLSDGTNWDNHAGFADYIRDQQIVASGRFETAPEKRTIKNDEYVWDITYYADGSGVLAIKTIDLNQDGKDEMLIIKMSQINENNYITASVLEEKDNIIVESPEIILLEDTFRFEDEHNIVLSETAIAGDYSEEDRIEKNQELANIDLSGDFWVSEMISAQNPDVEIVCDLKAGFEGYADWEELNTDYQAFTESDNHKLKPIVLTIRDESDLSAFLSENGI